MKKTIVAMFVLLAASSAFAAGDEMRKLDYMLGEWKGEGWMQRGPGEPSRSFVDEKIRSVAGGTAIAIEGRGNRKLENGSSGDVVHDAFGVIWYDGEAKKYRFSAFTAAQGHVDASFDLLGDTSARWGFTTPQGQIRYTIRMTEKGEWNEQGEFSPDGQKWMKFFEMTLQKMK